MTDKRHRAPLRYEELTPAELEEAIADCGAFIIPNGLLEWHGDHLPLGLDALKIQAIACDVSRRTGAVVLPVNYWGHGGYGAFCGTLVFSEELVGALYGEMFAQLEKIGARLVVLITGHYGPAQVDLIKKSAADYMKRSRLLVIAHPEYEAITMDSGEQPCDHAGKYETSFALHYFPELVRLDLFRRGECPIKHYARENERWPEEDPSVNWIWKEDLSRIASADLGADAAERIVNHVAMEIETALKRIDKG